MAKTKTPRRRELVESLLPDERLRNPHAAPDVDELLDLTANASNDAAAASPSELSPAPPKPAELVIRPAAVEVPLAQFRPEVRQFTHVEAVLTPAQGRTLRRLFDALDHDHLRMANGKHVNSAADCVRWLLDRLNERAE